MFVVYKNWAFEENAQEKMQHNFAVYQKIKDQAIVKWVGRGYAHEKYEIVSNPNQLTQDELALICDKGNLCFGYRMQNGTFIIHTD